MGTFKCAYDAAVAVAERNKQIAAQVECDDTDAASSMGGVKVEVTASSNGYRVTVTLADGSQVCCSRSKLDGMRTSWYNEKGHAFTVPASTLGGITDGDAIMLEPFSKRGVRAARTLAARRASP